MTETFIVRELACGLLNREETPPSLQALELAIISWRQLATEQKRNPDKLLTVMANSLRFLYWNETADPSGARPNRA
jgi:hypothetical protein